MSRSPESHRLRPAYVVLAAVLLGVSALSACAASGRGTTAPSTVIVTRTASGPSSTSASSSATSAAPKSSKPAKPATVVRVTALQNDGQTYGVGMPIVLYFRPAPTSAAAFEKAAKVTVDGKPAGGAWFWEQPTADEKKSGTIEAHYRQQLPWPADSQVHVALPIGGVSAGTGKVYGKALSSLSFSIGDKHLSTVDAPHLSMQVTSNDKPVKTIRVSLGKAATPTYNGMKVVMQKGEDIPGTDTLRGNGTVLMSGPGYSGDPVQWSVRVTQSGEYVHAAPWNKAIGQRSTSNGCTNLQVADAKWFYGFSQLGDLVQYVGTDGGVMPSWDGLGDWNVEWGTWQAGGLLSA